MPGEGTDLHKNNFERKKKVKQAVIFSPILPHSISGNNRGRAAVNGNGIS